MNIINANLEFRNGLSYNAISIGIDEHNALVEVTCYLCNKYGINRICGHRELNSTDCPGSNFPIDKMKTEVWGGVDGIVGVNTWNELIR